MPPMEIIGRLKGALTITCWTCKRSVSWTPREAAQRLGEGCTVPRARRRLRCSACGTKGKVNFG